MGRCPLAGGPEPSDDRGVGTAEGSSSPGRTPWDPVNGMRVGAMVGGLVGALAMTITGLANLWIVIGGGVIGGAVGFWSEKRNQRNRPATRRWRRRGSR